MLNIVGKQHWWFHMYDKLMASWGHLLHWLWFLLSIFLPHCAVEEAYTNNILVCYNKASTIRWHRQLQLLLNSQKHTQCSKTIVQVRSYAAPKCFTNPCASNTNVGEIKPRCRWAAIRSASCCNQPFLSASLLTENPTDFLGGPASAERKERNMHELWLKDKPPM